MRTLIFGDIHGCSSAFDALLETVSPVPGEDSIILLGDLVDRGPDAPGVIERAMKLEAQFKTGFTLLRGNHEDYWLNPSPSVNERLMHFYVGRRATEKAFKSSGRDIEQSLAWLKAHSDRYYDDGFIRCAHAGALVYPLQMNDTDTLTHRHDLTQRNMYMGPLVFTGHIALEKAAWFAGDRVNVQELDDKTAYQLPQKGIICIDTGCGKGGRLSCAVIKDDSFTLHSVPEDKK